MHESIQPLHAKRLNELATWLENGAKHERITFDLEDGIRIKASTYNPDEPAACGTSCCIAGAAIQFFDENWVIEALRNFHVDLTEDDESPDYELSWHKTFFNAQKLLGLSFVNACKLFVPSRRDEAEYEPFKDAVEEMYDGTVGWLMPSVMHSDVLEDFNDPAWAARTIRHYLATGDVNWEAAL